jgi:hypothetical protein
VHGLIAQNSDISAWSFGGSILTFLFPMLLFIGVALALYVLYTKPEVVPGHRAPTAERPVSYTAIPGMPTAAADNVTAASGSPAASSGTPPAAGGTKTADSENAGHEGGE